MKKLVNVVTVTVFIIAFLLGYGVSSRIVNRKQAEEAASQAMTRTEGTKPESALADISASTTDETNVVSADGQPAGAAVAVAVKLSKEAWVAVHEDAGDRPGNILGAQFFPAGAHLGKIDLLRGTEAGKKYYVMLHADNGDHAFDYEIDIPVKNAAGDLVMHAFMATANPPAQQ